VDRHESSVTVYSLDGEQCKARTKVVESRKSQSDLSTKHEDEMTRGKNRPGTRRDLMLAVWESLDCESVGARELEEIQRVVAEQFGDGAVESPASVARILADEGAVLRHPEVLESDAKWREGNLSQSTARADLDFSTLSAAADSFKELERLRQEPGKTGDDRGLRELRDTVLRIKQDRLLIAGSKVLSESERAVAKEISNWLDVWLSTPEMLADWLELRQVSPEFRDRFSKR
jgi:hypothetical protein